MRLRQLRQLAGAAGFAGRLYTDQATSLYAAHVLKDPFSRLRQAPGREDP